MRYLSAHGINFFWVVNMCSCVKRLVNLEGGVKRDLPCVWLWLVYGDTWHFSLFYVRYSRIHFPLCTYSFARSSYLAWVHVYMSVYQRRMVDCLESSWLKWFVISSHDDFPQCHAYWPDDYKMTWWAKSSLPLPSRLRLHCCINALLDQLRANFVVVPSAMTLFQLCFFHDDDNSENRARTICSWLITMMMTKRNWLQLETWLTRTKDDERMSEYKSIIHIFHFFIFSVLSKKI